MFDSFEPQPRPAHLKWSYKRIPPGGSLNCWVAGPLVGIPVHWADNSKPCRKKLTGGLLTCPYCVSELRLRWLGYQPVWDQRGAQLVVTVSETVGPMCKVLAFGTATCFWRSAGQRDPLKVRVLQPLELGRFPDAWHRSGSQDIRRWLLHLWTDRELAAFFEAAILKEAGQSVPSDPQSPQPVQSAPALQPGESDHGHAAPPPADSGPRAGPASAAKPRAGRGAGRKR